ncbi:unnamed protein product [Cunninghamella blakesleeana]
MATVYTFVKGGSHITNVIEGAWDADGARYQPVDFRLETTYKTILLYDEKDMFRRREALLKSKYTNMWTQNKTEIKGYDTTFILKRHGFWTTKWSFDDAFDGIHKTYTWKISGWETKWKLRDDQDNLIAEFERASYSVRKQGELTIYKQVPSYLLSLIIISHKVLHKQLKQDEASRAAAN